MNEDDDNDTPQKSILTKVRERVEECFSHADKFYGERVPRCSIKFDLTGTKAGTASPGKKLLRFNRKLLVANEGHFLETTVPHECAHIVQYWKYWTPTSSIEPHGREWKKVMVEVFRIPPHVRHRLDVSQVRKKTKEYRYTCACPGKTFMVGAIKHKKIQRGNSCHCPKCMRTIEFEGKGQVASKGLQETELD